MSKYHLLIDKFIDGSISNNERRDLERWILESEGNLIIFKNYLKDSNRKVVADFDVDFAYQKFTEKLRSKKTTPNFFNTLWKYAAMLAILLTIGYLAKRQMGSAVSEASIKVVENGKTTAAPNEAVIKLADGTTKILSPEGYDSITDASGTIIAKKGENSLSFDEGGTSAKNPPIYNEVFIPFGQIFRLTLSDGTLVWLNAGSKLRFPQNLVNSKKNRTVYLEGEAFFDVAKNKERPFIVNTQEVDVKVHGTKFNVSSYETDTSIATTLVEGSVSIYETGTPENALRLAPGYQASYDKFSNNFSKSNVDPSLYTAWMHDRLVINNLKFSEILVRLERKYAVKIINKNEKLNDEMYTGEFDGENIASILKTIALSTPFKYEINQNVITITE